METDAASEPLSIRLTRTNAEVTDQPFTIVQLQDVLKDDLYDDLCATFPTPDEGWGCNRGLDSKSFIQSNDRTSTTLCAPLLLGIPSSKPFLAKISGTTLAR
jgi:hypothetical protein